MDINFSRHFNLNKLYFGSLFVFITLLYACGNEPTQNDTPKVKADLPAATRVVNLYTNRYSKVEENLYTQFEQQKGIKINVHTGTPTELLERMESEVNAVVTDVVIFDELSWMYQAKAAGLLQPFSSDSTTNAMHSRNTDYEGTWVGLSKWTMGYGCSRQAIPKPSLVNTYADILDKKWKGRVLLSTAENRGNTFLVATMIAEKGEKATAKWLKRLIGNLAMAPLENEAAVIKALADGKGDISFLNSSEHIRWTNSGNTEHFEIGEKVGVKTPFDANDKTYYNITSIGLLLNAPSRQDAMTFIDFLVSRNAQQNYCDYIFEYPVNVFTLPSDFLMNIGSFKEQTLDFNAAAANMDLARTLMTKAGWK